MRISKSEKLKPVLAIFILVSCFATSHAARANSIEHFGIDKDIMVRFIHAEDLKSVLRSFKHWTGKGYRPVQVTSHVVVGRPQYSEIFALDEDSSFPWISRARMTLAKLRKNIRKFGPRGYRPTSISAYRENGVDRFTMTWIRDGRKIPYVVRTHQTSAQFQKEFDSPKGLVRRRYRPVYVHGYPTGRKSWRIASIFIRDRKTPRDWVARRDYKMADFLKSLQKLRGKGFRPISVSGYRAGNTTLFSAVSIRNVREANWTVFLNIKQGELRKIDREQSAQGRRLFTLSGYEVRGKSRYAGVWIGPSTKNHWTVRGHPDPSLKGKFEDPFDKAFKKYMTRKGKEISAGALAVVKNGRLVLARGYTYAPRGFRITRPDSQFRIASLSKAITATAILKLVEEGRIKLNRPVSSYLELKVTPRDPRWRAKKVSDLLYHDSGLRRWPSNVTDVTIVKKSKGRYRLPLTTQDILDYTIEKKILSFPPGGGYSNLGFMMLGRVIESVTSKKYKNKKYKNYAHYVRKTILGPLRMRRTVPGRSPRLKRRPHEVVYFHPEVDPIECKQRCKTSIGRNALNLEPRMVTRMYGGGKNLANFIATGGWVSTAVDMARFARSFDDPRRSPLRPRTVRKMFTPRTTGWLDGKRNTERAYGMGWTIYLPSATGAAPPGTQAKGGSIKGIGASMARRPDGVIFVWMLNRTGASMTSRLHREVQKVEKKNAWPSVNYFDRY